MKEGGSLTARFFSVCFFLKRHCSLSRKQVRPSSGALSYYFPPPRLSFLSTISVVPHFAVAFADFGHGSPGLKTVFPIFERR